MKTNDSTNACPKCGAPVPAEAPQGLCPRCVLAQAVAAEPAPTATSQIPSIERLAIAFPQLQIIELIGRGGMGFVFKARQPHLDRFVALKLLPDSLAHDPQFAERFNREGRVLARLNHPNIVSIFDFGQAGGFYFLMMEYVDGVNLRQAMQAGRFSPSEALAIVPKICEALQFAHDEGILHRDIKPENILLDAKGRVKIADFGIAKLVGEEKSDASLTATGAALGTMHYMAPEQIEKPATVDHRADIYSLGVVFYELLTGELPLGRFGPPSEKTPVDTRVDDVVMRTLEKEREKRFQSAGEMGTTVEHLTEVGAGSFKGVPPKAPGAEPQRGPGGTIVIKPEHVVSATPTWSLKAIWGAVLAGISFLPIIVLLIFIACSGAHGPLGGWEIILILASLGLSMPAIAGTILGWMGLSDIRAHTNQRRGLPLATFAALAWPLGLLLLGLVVAPLWFFLVTVPARSGGLPVISATLMLLLSAGVITFAIWAVYATTRWGANQPAVERRGKLKWVFLAVVAGGLGFIALSTISNVQLNRARARAEATPSAVTADTNTTPWIRFTFTAVELREVKGVRWLAIDYLDDVHGECEKSFPWETTIPGFKAETRTTEFLKEGKDSSPEVRHQRIEYRMPDSSSRDQLERLRDNLEKALKQKSFRLELRDNEIPLLLFELPGVEGGSLQARIKVVPPLQVPISKSQVGLRGPSQINDSLWLHTDTELPLGDHFVSLLKRPDGSVEEHPAGANAIRSNGKTTVSTSFYWPMVSFKSNRIAEIATGLREKFDGRVVGLSSRQPFPIFVVTNDRGGVIEGSFELRPGSASSGDKPFVSLTIATTHTWPNMVIAYLQITGPFGYTPQGVGVYGDGSEVDTHTSFSRPNNSCCWNLPPGFSTPEAEAIARQLEAIKDTAPNGLRIAPGERVPVFAVTNRLGTAFRGYFELPMTNGTR